MRETPEIPDLPAVIDTPKRFFLGKTGKLVGAAASLALFLIAAYVLGRTLSHVRLAQLGAAIKETDFKVLFDALLLTALSYLALAGYDLAALRQIGARAPIGSVALASFASNAFSFTLGFPLLTGAAVRYWVYVRAALTARQIANVTLVASVTFWLGMAGLLGAGLVFAASPLSQVDHLPAPLNFLIGCAIIGAIAYYCIWVAQERRSLRLLGSEMELPGPQTMLTQLLLGMADISCAAGALYALLPPESRAIGFSAFAAIYVFAALVGSVSHAPGGVGVFEAVMFGALTATSQELLLAALLLFRAVYFLIPFALALALLGSQNGSGLWSGLMDACRRTAERRGAS